MIISAPANITLLYVLWGAFSVMIMIGFLRSVITKRKIRKLEMSLASRLMAIAGLMGIEVRYDPTLETGTSKTLLSNTPDLKDLILISEEKLGAGDLSTILCCQLGAILYHLYMIHEQCVSALGEEADAPRNAAALAIMGLLMGPSLKREHKIILSAYFEVFGLDGEAINRNKDVIRYVTINIASLMGITKDSKCTLQEDRKQAYVNK